MKNKSSAKNPFGPNAKGYLWELFSALGPSSSHLDYGAHDGKMLHLLAQDGKIFEGVGVDLNSTVVERAVPLLPSNVKLFTVKKNMQLPFPDSKFSTVSMVGVLEHIKNQAHIIEELKRVTRPGGMMLFAVPGKHFFSFMDMGNWKFIFPKTHRWFYLLNHTEEDYNKRYTENKDGMIGDIEAEKAWHQHFSPEELIALLNQHGLQLLYHDGAGFFSRIFMNVRFFLPDILKKMLDPLIRWDNEFFHYSEIWVLVRKPD